MDSAPVHLNVKIIVEKDLSCSTRLLDRLISVCLCVRSARPDPWTFERFSALILTAFLFGENITLGNHTEGVSEDLFKPPVLSSHSKVLFSCVSGYLFLD